MSIDGAVFDARRMASVTSRMAERLLGKRDMGEDGLRHYRLNDVEVEDLVWSTYHLVDMIEAIADEEAEIEKAQRECVRVSPGLAQRIIALAEARGAWDAVKNGDDVLAHRDVQDSAVRALDAFLSEPCLSFVDSQLKLRAVLDDPVMQEALAMRDDGGLAFIRSLMPHDLISPEAA